MIRVLLPALLLPALWTGSPPVQDRPATAPDFPTEVHPWLSRLGCNAAGCHGAASGQKGFHLSLFGGDPDADYESIAREFNGRRLDRAEPADSLLLLKALKKIPHGGGKVLEKDSEPYRVFLAWIAAGAPRRSATRRLESLAARLEQGRIRVEARYDDGTLRDVTASSTFASNDEGVASVDATGLVTPAGPGAGAILVRHGGRSTAVPVSTPYGSAPAGTAADPVDAAVAAQLGRLGLPASPRASDFALLRRTTLDLAGRLPTAAEISAGRADVAALLASDDFHRTWGGHLARIAGTPAAAPWFAARLKEGAGWDAVMRALVTASGNGPETAFLRASPDPKTLGENAGRAFLGTRWSCALCHDHPYERFTRHDYYGVAAFFARVRHRDGISISAKDELVYPPTGLEVAPAFPDGAKVPEGADRRAAFADWLRSRDAARAIVNRAWALLLGRGLVHPVDDLRPSNPPTNGPLLELLVDGFLADGWDVAKLVGRIVRSGTYARSPAPVDGNRGDDRHYSRALVRPLDPALLGAITAQAAGVPTVGPVAPAGLPRALQAINGAVPPPPSADVEQLFLRTLSRPPSDRERALARTPEELADLWWALLNSLEFTTNH